MQNYTFTTNKIFRVDVYVKRAIIHLSSYYNIIQTFIRRKLVEKKIVSLSEQQCSILRQWTVRGEYLKKVPKIKYFSTAEVRRKNKYFAVRKERDKQENELLALGRLDARKNELASSVNALSCLPYAQAFDCNTTANQHRVHVTTTHTKQCVSK